MAIKGMQRDRTGHIGPDGWKNDKQNEQRGAHEKGEQAAAAALGADDSPDSQTGEPVQSVDSKAATAQPRRSV